MGPVVAILVPVLIVRGHAAAVLCHYAGGGLRERISAVSTEVWRRADVVAGHDAGERRVLPKCQRSGPGISRASSIRTQGRELPYTTA